LHFTIASLEYTGTHNPCMLPDSQLRPIFSSTDETSSVVAFTCQPILRPNGFLSNGKLPEPDAQLASVADEKVWIKESFEAAKADVYASPIGVVAGPFTLTDSYKSTALSVAKQRVALAGARLANLLNATLK
jgi:S1/P1 Nuclease